MAKSSTVSQLACGSSLTSPFTSNSIITATRSVDITESNINSNAGVYVSSKDFELLSVIGKGGYGKVFLARKVTPNPPRRRSGLVDNNMNGTSSSALEDKLYAIKVLKKARIIQSELESRQTLSERKILEMLKHPFLVELVFAYQTSGKLYLVLEYQAGGELFTHIERKKSFLEEEAKFYISEISLAIGHLHSIGVIYRDLKPENVLLDAQGHIKLSDFGLSKTRIDASGRPELTYTVCGTVAYMAPEILLHCGHGKDVDWWSLGVLLYDMLSSGPPFFAPNRAELKKKVISGKFAPLKFATRNCQNLIRQLICKRVEARLGSGEADVSSVKAHPFFSGIDFEAVLARSLPPPINIELSHARDLAYFDAQFTRMALNSESASPESSSVSNATTTATTGAANDATSGPTQCVQSALEDIFEGFSYVNPRLFENLRRDSWGVSAVEEDDVATATPNQNGMRSRNRSSSSFSSCDATAAAATTTANQNLNQTCLSFLTNQIAAKSTQKQFINFDEFEDNDHQHNHNGAEIHDVINDNHDNTADDGDNSDVFQDCDESSNVNGATNGNAKLNESQNILGQSEQSANQEIRIGHDNNNNHHHHDEQSHLNGHPNDKKNNNSASPNQNSQKKPRNRKRKRKSPKV